MPSRNFPTPLSKLREGLGSFRLQYLSRLDESQVSDSMFPPWLTVSELSDSMFLHCAKDSELPDSMFPHCAEVSQLSCSILLNPSIANYSIISCLLVWEIHKNLIFLSLFASDWDNFCTFASCFARDTRHSRLYTSNHHLGQRSQPAKECRRIVRRRFDGCRGLWWAGSA